MSFTSFGLTVVFNENIQQDLLSSRVGRVEGQQKKQRTKMNRFFLHLAKVACGLHPLESDVYFRHQFPFSAYRHNTTIL